MRKKKAGKQAHPALGQQHKVIETVADQIRWQSASESSILSFSGIIIIDRPHFPTPIQPLMSLWNRTFTAIGNHSRRFASQAPAHGHLPNSQSPFTPKLKFFNSVNSDGSKIPTYRVLDGIGIPLEGAELPKVSQSHLRSSIPHIYVPAGRLTRHSPVNCTRSSEFHSQGLRSICSRYEKMLLLPTIDTLMNNVQRQGKISFYVCSPSRFGVPRLPCTQMTSVSTSW